MNASTADELGAFVPAVGVSFENFGGATQGDIDMMKEELKLDSRQRMTLQGIWARYPFRTGEKSAYINAI